MDRKRCQDESATVHGNYGKHGRLRKEAGAPAEPTKTPTVSLLTMAVGQTYWHAWAGCFHAVSTSSSKSQVRVSEPPRQLQHESLCSYLASPLQRKFGSAIVGGAEGGGEGGPLLGSISQLDRAHQPRLHCTAATDRGLLAGAGMDMAVGCGQRGRRICSMHARTASHCSQQRKQQVFSRDARDSRPGSGSGSGPYIGMYL